MYKLLAAGICCILALLNITHQLPGDAAICLCITSVLWGFGADDISKKKEVTPKSEYPERSPIYRVAVPYFIPLNSL